MGEFVDESKRLRRGSILIIDYDEWRNFIGYCESSEHALVEIGVVGSEIPNEQHEHSKRFDSVPESREQFG